MVLTEAYLDRLEERVDRMERLLERSEAWLQSEVADCSQELKDLRRTAESERPRSEARGEAARSSLLETEGKLLALLQGDRERHREELMPVLEEVQTLETDILEQARSRTEHEVRVSTELTGALQVLQETVQGETSPEASGEVAAAAWSAGFAPLSELSAKLDLQSRQRQEFRVQFERRVDGLCGRFLRELQEEGRSRRQRHEAMEAVLEEFKGRALAVVSVQGAATQRRLWSLDEPLEGCENT
eukprot:TRINITY_DN94055_c0_g1_i1.p1 TRINITY_DN94055_c0_g1~~TRINITY_DN94055_c0_g1_i1.p1  ORF type:complete len:244 (-),score=55.35 TRINITY_DN94055_c0_g1_i1:295-1026(-)